MTMKTISNYLLIIIILGLAPGLLSQNIRVFFYAPAAAITANFTGATAAYIHRDSCGPNSTGYSYVLLDGNTASIFRTMTLGLRIRATYDSLVNLNSLMRKRISTLSVLSNGLVNDIDISIFDDRTGLNATETCKCDFQSGALRGIWPCANNFRDKDGKYWGWLNLGELAANVIIANGAGGYWAWNETVVHEFSHTQFAVEYLSTGGAVRNKWGRNGLAISYGGDDGHWGDELQADPQSALDEGMATFWGLEHNKVGRDALINFLNMKTNRLVLGSHSFLTGTPQMWDAPHTVSFDGTIPANKQVVTSCCGTIKLVAPHIQTGGRYILRSYKWLDVPGDYVFYNEQMFQGFAQLFHELALVRNDTAFNMIVKSAQAMTPPRERLRYPSFMANHIANSMELYASSVQGRAEETAKTLTSSMFVYALYDIITHFGITEARLKREFTISMATYLPTPKPKAFDQYWTHRAAVKALACPHLGGNNCMPGAGNIDIVKAIIAARDYFRDPSRILR